MGRTISEAIRDLLQALVYSNVYISLAGASMAIVTLILADLPLTLEPVFLAFTIPFFVYNLNRFTDRAEDAVNVPQRTAFVKQYGRVLLFIGVLLYVFGLGLAYTRNVWTILLMLTPGIAGASYSLLRLKKLLLAKNLIVGASWGFIPLMVGAYFGVLTTELIVLALFFSIALFNNTIVFDIKDIDGDKKEGIRTAPNTLGVQTAKNLAHVSNLALASCIILFVLIHAVPAAFLFLLLLNLYAAGYIHFATEERSTLFYGIIVDGEYAFLALITSFLSILGL